MPDDDRVVCLRMEEIQTVGTRRASERTEAPRGLARGTHGGCVGVPGLGGAVPGRPHPKASDSAFKSRPGGTNSR